MLEETILSMLHISPFAYSDPSRSWLIFVRSERECLHVLSHSRKYNNTAESYGGLKPSKQHLDQKKTNSNLVKICFFLLLLSHWWHNNPSWFLFCSEEVKGDIFNLFHTPAEEILCITSDTKTNSDNLPVSSTSTYFPSTLLLSVPFQIEMWLPADTPLVAAH